MLKAFASRSVIYECDRREKGESSKLAPAFCKASELLAYLFTNLCSLICIDGLLAQTLLHSEFFTSLKDVSGIHARAIFFFF